jgi:preprotein translocase subunit SecE
MAKEAKSNKEVKNKKHFFKDFKAELKKVIWPTPKQLVNKTVAVIVIVLITAAIVFVLDLVFDLLNEKGINKVKAKIANEELAEGTTYNIEDIINTVEVNEANTIEVNEVNTVEESPVENAE